MDSDEGSFWDQRYGREGAIWGESPSPTAVEATGYLRHNARVLDLGFGYGRDLPFLIRQGCRVSGIDLSTVGRRLAEDRLGHEGLHPECLLTGKFEDTHFPGGPFDVIVCHRVAHLLLTGEAIDHFADKVCQVLRPGGILCLGVRDTHDLNPADMVAVEAGVYEYIRRPGHRIRYWDDKAFEQVFGRDFDILALSRRVEDESRSQPIPCHVTIMVGRKKGQG